MSESLHLASILPHDLLVVSGVDALLSGEKLPAWARETLTQAPMVVVRRARVEDGLIPVGLRGRHRGERAAALLPSRRIIELIHPEHLAVSHAWRTTQRAAILPHFSVLNSVADILNKLGLAWGPIGGMGFELASDHPCLTGTSDIDLIIRAPEPLPREAAAGLHAALSDMPVRIDVQVEVPAGAIALAEYASDRRQIVLRTATEPRLITDPWREAVK